jgi:hypothetical protein
MQSNENGASFWCFLSCRVCNYKCSSGKQNDPNFNPFDLEVKQIWWCWCLPCNHRWWMNNRQIRFTETIWARIRTVTNGQQLWLLVMRHVLCYQCNGYYTGWSTDSVAVHKIWIHHTHTYIRIFHGSINMSQRKYDIEQIINVQNTCIPRIRI